MQKSKWHYPRVELARYFYDLLIDTPASSVSLFGERRIGKTEFLLQDLAPYARDAGHRVIYADLWSLKDAPLAVLLKSLDDAYQTQSNSGFTRILKNSKAKLAIRPPGLEATVEIDMKDMKGVEQENHFHKLADYCRALSNERHPTFLLIDEFQQLARTNDTDALIAALRSIFQEHKSGLVTVFTGSSQDDLRAMLTNVNAPFYQFSEQEALPELGEDFVRHQLGVILENRPSKQLELTEALDVFERVEHSPLFFQKWAIKMTHPSDYSASKAVDIVLQELGLQQNWEHLWNSLSPFQRAMARQVAEGHANVYAADFKAKLAKLTGRTEVEDPAAQNAVRRLTNNQIITKAGTGRIVPDPLLAFWIRSRPDSDFLEIS